VVDDLYASLRTVVAALADAGFSAQAEQVSDAMRAGATPTEVLMAARWSLGRMLAEVPTLPAPLRDDVEDLHTKLSDLLDSR
jgi:hypothetical protein